MKGLLEIIVKALVDTPEQVNITEILGKNVTVFEIRVAAEDIGKIIGKQGRIAKAMRAVVKTAALRENKKIIIEIV